MAFSPIQVASLSAALSKAHVKSRSQSGRSLSYVESWHVIAEANRIFGFDGWTSETIDLRLVAERERKIGQAQKDGWSVSYVAKVRITVFAGDTLITREGVGAGHGIDVDVGQAHESASKEAESDARKRALMTFGNPFGLALYDKEQTNVSDEPPISAKVEAIKTKLDECTTDAAVSTFWTANKSNFEKLSDTEYAIIRDYAKQRRAVLQAATGAAA